MPTIKLSYIITSVIALIALISPIIVSIINNKYQVKIKQIELKNNVQKKILETYYSDKSVAFHSFLINAGKYCSNYWNQEYHALMLSSLECVLLFCENKDTTRLLIEFSFFINKKFSTLRNDNKDITDILELTNKVSEISVALNKELINTITFV